MTKSNEKESEEWYITGVIAVATLTVCSILGTNCTARRIENKIDGLIKKYTLKSENVFGNSEPEKFYEIDGRKVYLEIDGKSIEQYVQPEKQ